MDEHNKKMYEKWMAPGSTPREMIDSAKNSATTIHTNGGKTKSILRSSAFHLAQKTVEAATPVLHKFGQGMITNVGDVPCFLLITMGTHQGQGTTVQCSLNIMNAKVEGDVQEDGRENGESKQKAPLALVCTGHEAKDLAAAFLLDFRDANFLYVNSQGDPKRLILLTPQSITQKCPGLEKQPMTLRHIEELLKRQIYQFNVGCEQ